MIYKWKNLQDKSGSDDSCIVHLLLTTVSAMGSVLPLEQQFQICKECQTRQVLTPGVALNMLFHFTYI